jgi:hypothetical protein
MEMVEVRERQFREFLELWKEQENGDKCRYFYERLL